MIVVIGRDCHVIVVIGHVIVIDCGHWACDCHVIVVVSIQPSMCMVCSSHVMIT